jgi:Cytochrome c7 and related cytochrome c
MAQIFHRSTNTLARVSIFGALFFVAALLFGFAILDRSPYNTGQDLVLMQPVPFSHSHHVAGLGIDCRYCHTSVEKAASAGIPPSATCMNCHKQIWSDSEMLAPVRESFASGEPIRWIRVHDLPDFVYFDHSIHIAKGVGCVSCHGRVDQMPLMRRASSLQMIWCLECHRAPERFVRPADQVFSMTWKAEDQVALGSELVAAHDIRSRTNCDSCHR